MLRTLGVSLLALSLLSLAACGDDATEQQHLDPATWCDSVAGGPPGTRGLAADLSAAHADVRFFGSELDGGTADVALADALNAPDALTDGGIAQTLADYKASLVNVCVVPASDAPVPAAKVELKGAVAVIHPGTGEVVVPAEAAAVAIDLRDLPNREDIEPGLEAAVAAALSGSSARGQWLIRSNVGLAPELKAYATPVLRTTFGKLTPFPLEGTAAHVLPLAVITGPKMGDAAAELAADLRLANKAWIIGSDVRMAVAESCWEGVGTLGIAYRCRELSSGSHRWPDAVRADYPIDQLDGTLSQLPSFSPPPSVGTVFTDERPLMEIADPTHRPEPTTTRLGDVRAALITAHGAARRFYPYLTTLGDTIDARLSETLDAVGAAPDRASALALLQRFGEALADGQAFASDLIDTSTDKLPLLLEQVAGEPVVRASGDTGVHPGDRIAAVDGVPFATWYEEVAPRLSASTEAFRLQRAFDLLVSREAATLTLVDVNGVSRDVSVGAQADSVLQDTRKGAMAASGLLAGTNLFYVNADGTRLATKDDLNKLLDQAKDADGLILDLRGRPVVDAYELAAAVLIQNFQSPLFHTPTWQGPLVFDPGTNQKAYNANSLSFDKKVAVLVGPSTVSNAEVAATAIWDQVEGKSPVRVTLVGRPTAGTAGNPTALSLPGDFGFVFTGVEMLHADGETVFAGAGITPDVTAAPTQADLANGVDTELQAAITALSAP